MNRSSVLKQMLVVTAGCAVVLGAGGAMAQSMSPNAKPPSFPMSSKQPPAQPAPDMQAVLDAQQALGAKPIEMLTPAQARVQPTPSDGVMQVMKAQGQDTTPDPSVTTKDMAYGPDPMEKARIYMPAAASGGAPLPVIVYYHGGGWVIADLKTYDATPRFLSKQLNAIVVSVEYRHAPEHRFPAQHEDANMAYDCVVKNAAAWGGDPSKMALAGESAGGNLVVNVGIHARDVRMVQPKAILAVYLIASGNPKTRSKMDFANAKPLNTPMLMWFGYYVTRTPADMMDPRWDLTKADLRGLPPLTIVNAEIDPLRDDGAALERAATGAGVSVNRRVFPGVTHEFFGMGKVVRGAYDAEAYAVAQMKTAFGM